MRIPPVSPMDRAKRTDSTRESFAGASTGRLYHAEARSAAGAAGEVQDEAANHVGFRPLARSLAQINGLLQRMGGLFLFAHPVEHVAEEHPSGRVALVESTRLAQADGRSAQFSLAPELLGAKRELLGSTADEDLR